jgi:hypothetical protein
MGVGEDAIACQPVKIQLCQDSRILAKNPALLQVIQAGEGNGRQKIYPHYTIA